MNRLFLFALAPAVFSYGAEPVRPRILGVPQVAFFTSNPGESVKYYRDFLGFEQAPAAGSPSLLFKINDRQFLELQPEKAVGTDRLIHLYLETDDAEGMRRYLAARGVAVPDKAAKSDTGDSVLEVKDPKGHVIRFVQFGRGGLPSKTKGKYLGVNRISHRMMHVGIIVNELGPHMKFYKDVLGFREFWRGSGSGKELSWINMRVPDGEGYVEFMLHKEDPAPTARGSAHHICLEVPDIQAALKALEGNPHRSSYKRPLEARVGRNRKRHLNVFDPDGTRTELMEPGTVDGVPAPSSEAPWPK